MKKLNKIYETLISERLMDVDNDVNIIYETYFKSDFDEIGSTGILNINMFKNSVTHTETLISPVAIKANKINPCKIIINSKTSGNHYNPSGKVISITVNKGAVNFINNNGSDLNRAKGFLDDDSGKSLNREFKESTIKGSIHHELSHWLDDTLHNSHIDKRLKKVHQTNKNVLPINADKMEIQAQIHNIKQLKNKYSEIWDELSFIEMIKYSPSLTSISDKFNDDIKTEWVRNLKTRMYREGLLGNNMR